MQHVVCGCIFVNLDGMLAYEASFAVIRRKRAPVGPDAMTSSHT